MDFIDIGLYAGYLLVAVCAVVAIIMPLIQSLGDPKSLIKSGVGVALLVVVFFVSYAMADGTAVGEATEGTSKMVGAGLFTTYVFFFGAIGGIIYTEISKILN